ncbi:hypothetical protein Tco_0180188 [Tanacetum coccineum]
MYDSWKSRMELYIDNRENGRMILNSVENGPLILPTVEENGETRKKKYEELSTAEKLQADCDLKATNIVLQGLPHYYLLCRVPALISQVHGPSRKRSRSPSSPFFLIAIHYFSDGSTKIETSELNPKDVTARLEDLEVEIDTLHADTEDKELLISELQDSLAAAENEIVMLQIRVADAEDRHAEDHDQIQKILARLGL